VEQQSEHPADKARRRIEAALADLTADYYERLRSLPLDDVRHAAEQHGMTLVRYRHDFTPSEMATKPLSPAELDRVAHNGEAIYSTLQRLGLTREAGGLDLSHPADFHEMARTCLDAREDWPRMVTTIRALQEALADRDREIAELQAALLRHTST